MMEKLPLLYTIHKDNFPLCLIVVKNDKIRCAIFFIYFAVRLFRRNPNVLFFTTPVSFFSSFVFSATYESIFKLVANTLLCSNVIEKKIEQGSVLLFWQTSRWSFDDAVAVVKICLNITFPCKDLETTHIIIYGSCYIIRSFSPSCFFLFRRRRYLYFTNKFSQF